MTDRNRKCCIGAIAASIDDTPYASSVMIDMGDFHMSKRKKRPGRSFQKARNGPKKPASLRPALTPEQLIEKGNLPEAISLLKAELERVPSNDQRRRLLGHCLFEAKQYSEAAHTWLALGEAQPGDVVNVGIAFLNAREWDQAIAHLERALRQQEHARTYYLLACAQLREKDWWSVDGETAQRLVDLLQRARALPECPPEVYLRLDSVLWSLARREWETDEVEEEAWSRAREQSVQLLEEAFSRYPDHERIRLEFASGLIYWRKQYETGLQVLAPLLQRDDLEQYQFEKVVGLSVKAALQAGWHEKAREYLELIPIAPPAADSYWPGLTKLHGDLMLLQRDFAAARACYEQEIQSGSFVAQFLGLFSCAWSWLLEEKSEKALPLVERALAAWFELDNARHHNYAFDSEPVRVGGIHIGDESPALCVRQVCETLLQGDVNLAQTLRGQLSYLLYCYFAGYYEIRQDEGWEQKAEHEQLLVQAAQLFEHPLLSKALSSLYEERGDLPMAVDFHLRWCVQSFTRDSEHFDGDDAEYAAQSEEALSQELRQRIHDRAWAQLQAHQTASVVEAIFIPFYRSFWRDLLLEGKMHQEIVDVTAMFLRVGTTGDIDDEQWDYAYYSQDLVRLEEAEQAYRSYLQRRPGSGPALNNLAMILETKGSLQEALVLMEQALASDPEEELFLNNRNRLTKKLGDIQLAQGRERWSQLTDVQKQLLYLTDEYRPSTWSELFQHIRGEESRLQEHWEALLRSGTLTLTEGQAATIAPALLPQVRHEGLLLVLIADVISNTSPRKKHPWVPRLDEFAPDATSRLNKTQRTAFHKAAFKRLQAAQRPDVLAGVFLPFYRSTWKRILAEADMAQEIVEVVRILTTDLPGQTRPELWDYAYYAHNLSHLAVEAEQAYKRYLEGGAHVSAYHNLALLMERGGRLEDALAYAEQALALVPEKEDTLSLKERILRRIEQRKQDALRQQELAEQRQRQLENLIRTAPERWAKVDQYKRRILGTLAALNTFEGFRELAHLVDMEERVLKGHWNKLVEQGMVIEGEEDPRVNPHILDLVKRERTHAVVTRIVHTSSEMMTKPIFNSQQEYKIYSILLEVFPNQLVFPNMALQAIFPYARMQAVLSKEIFGYYLMASVDFCVTLTSTYLPLVAFEVDSDYHDSEKQRERDEKKDQIFAAGGIALIHLRAFGQPSPQAVRHDIIEAVRTWLRQWRAAPHQTGWAIDLEQELDFGRFGLNGQEEGAVEEI
jgi:tetratricopeptide (TPR) repeat protein